MNADNLMALAAEQFGVAKETMDLIAGWAAMASFKIKGITDLGMDYFRVEVEAEEGNQTQFMLKVTDHVETKGHRTIIRGSAE